MITLSVEELHQEGVKYYNGDGVKKDINKAIECFEKAIAIGSPKSKRALGFVLYGNGRAWAAETAEQKRGVQLLEEAAAEGDRVAKEWYVDQYEYAAVGAWILKLKFKSFDYEGTKQRAALAKQYAKELKQ